MVLEDLLRKLDRVEESVASKGHHMQDYSTLKLAVVDLIDIIRKLIENSKD